MPQLILADKSDLFRRSISSVLQREGYEVLPAETGAKVLSLCQEKLPAAIILDTETPDPSGLETLLTLKRDPKLRRVPVIVVSRDSAPTAVSNAFKVGAESFMLKPIDLNALLKALHSLETPVPTLNALVKSTFGENKVAGKLRFLDQYGLIYLDKDLSDFDEEVRKVWDPRTANGEAAGSTLAPGQLGVVSFERGKETFNQPVMMTEENEQGIAVYPVGIPSLAEKPELQKIPVNYKARYMMPGSFMKLADVGHVHGDGLRLTNLTEEPRPNSLVTVTLYPQTAGGEAGIALKGKVTASKPQGESLFEIDVQLTEPGGLPFVNLMAELISGRPARPVA